MTAVKLILDKKREGHALGSAEIRQFIEGFTRGEIPDYQMSALAMAICCRGMTERETADLTDAMMRSGRCLDWTLDIPTADKHSTGGVGDKTSLVVTPIVASLGVKVAKMSGRGLGHTGGTVDKLEAIPGLCTDLAVSEFERIVNETGIAIVRATRTIAIISARVFLNFFIM